MIVSFGILSANYLYPDFDLGRLTTNLEYNFQFQFLSTPLQAVLCSMVFSDG